MAIFYIHAHCSAVIINAMASQISGVSIVCSNVCPGADQRKHQSSASLAFLRGNHRWPVDYPHKGPITWKRFPFDDVIMCCRYMSIIYCSVVLGNGVLYFKVAHGKNIQHFVDESLDYIFHMQSLYFDNNLDCYRQQYMTRDFWQHFKCLVIPTTYILTSCSKKKPYGML